MREYRQLRNGAFWTAVENGGHGVPVDNSHRYHAQMVKGLAEGRSMITPYEDIKYLDEKRIDHPTPLWSAEDHEMVHRRARRRAQQTNRKPAIEDYTVIWEAMFEARYGLKDRRADSHKAGQD